MYNPDTDFQFNADVAICIAEAIEQDGFIDHDAYRTEIITDAEVSAIQDSARPTYYVDMQDELPF